MRIMDIPDKPDKPESDRFERELTEIMKPITDLITAQEATPSRAVASLFALCHVMVSLAYTICMDEEQKAISMLSTVMAKTIIRRKNALAQPNEKQEDKKT